VVDTKKEHIAVSEARKLGIPVIAVLDTNCDPDEVDYPIPGNDDAIRSVSLLTRVVADAVADGLMARGGEADGEDKPSPAGELGAEEPLAEWERELLEHKGPEDSAPAAGSAGSAAPAEAAPAVAAAPVEAAAPAETAAPAAADSTPAANGTPVTASVPAVDGADVSAADGANASADGADASAGEAAAAGTTASASARDGATTDASAEDASTEDASAKDGAPAGDTAGAK